MIARDVQTAAGARYDLVIVGGGIYGVAMALEAARRRLRPLVLEQADFGGATTWNSLRIIHGGFRYLQSLDLVRSKESMRERAWFMHHFPELVLPLGCLMPLYGRGLRRPGIARGALLADRWLRRLWNVNDGLPGSRILSIADTIDRFPQVDPRGLRGSLLWYDASVPVSQRLIIEMLHWATACGAVAVNYARAASLLTQHDAVVGVRAFDEVGRATVEFRAPIVVNCGGPWCRDIAQAFDRDVPRLFSYSTAFNLLLGHGMGSDLALAVSSRQPGSQTYFFHPFRDKVLVGTCHQSGGPTREETSIDGRAVQGFLDDLNVAIPSCRFEMGDVRRVLGGVQPAEVPGGSRAASRPTMVDHGLSGGPSGLYSVSGVKLTTARSVAQNTLREIARKGGGVLPPHVDEPRPAPSRWLPLDAFRELLEVDREQAAAVVRRHVREESVVHLDDLLLRRTDWGMDPTEGQLIAGEVMLMLGWDGERRERESARFATSDGHDVVGDGKTAGTR